MIAKISCLVEGCVYYPGNFLQRLCFSGPPSGGLVQLRIFQGQTGLTGKDIQVAHMIFSKEIGSGAIQTKKIQRLHRA